MPSRPKNSRHGDDHDSVDYSVVVSLEDQNNNNNKKNLLDPNVLGNLPRFVLNDQNANDEPRRREVRFHREAQPRFGETVISLNQRLQRCSTTTRAVFWVALQLLSSCNNDDDSQKNQTTTILQQWMERAQQQFSRDKDLIGNEDDEENDHEEEDTKQEHLLRWQSLPETELLLRQIKTATTTAAQSISSHQWVRLLACLAPHVVVWEQEHFLLPYSKTIIPQLSPEERDRVVKELDLDIRTLTNKDCDDGNSNKQESTTTSIALAVSKALQDQLPSQTFAALLQPPTGNDQNEPTALQLPHSCLPKATLEFDPKQQHQQQSRLAVTLLFASSGSSSTSDGKNTDHLPAIPQDISICRIANEDAVGGVEEREQQILILTGRSCGCLRCRYEMFREEHGNQTNEDINTNKDSAWLRNHWSIDELMELGRFYLGYQQDLDEAERLFWAVITKKGTSAATATATAPDNNNWDAWHARGAIALSRNRFLEAQRIWKDAQELYQRQQQQQSSSSLKVHEALELQWTKLQAYDYLSTPTTTNEVKSRSKQNGQSNQEGSPLCPHVFRSSSMLSQQMCQQVVSWAEGASWTKQRHYAVPTLDVPVHTVQPLLSWFHSWFMEQVRPLLKSQFQTRTSNYFVHDAFVVQYQATKPSNHLPIHTDESTHSFVLALNDDYDGGGTYLLESHRVVRLNAGELLSFRGDLVQHGGEAVTRGSRFILAVFLYYDEGGDVVDEDDGDGDAIHTETTGTIRSAQKTTSTHNKSIGKKRPIQSILSKEDDQTSFSFGFKL